MRMRLLLSLLGATILFVWGFAGHVVIRIYDPAYQAFSDEAEVAAVLERNAPAAGLYYLPLRPDRNAEPPAEAFVNFVPAGERSGFGKMVLRDLVIKAVAVYLVLTLLGGATTYWRGVARFTLAGFTIGFVVHAYYWNWFDFPGLYVGIAVLDATVGWTLVGLALIGLARMREQSARLDDPPRGPHTPRV